MSLRIGAEDVEVRTRQRLLGPSTQDRQVIWRSGDHSVLLRRDLIHARLQRGWLVVGIELLTEQTGRCPLELVYFVGDGERWNGTVGAVKINASTPQATALAEIWGTDLQRVVWDAVLDVVQSALQQAARRTRDQGVTLRGFHEVDGGLQVDVVTGAR